MTKLTSTAQPPTRQNLCGFVLAAGDACKDEREPEREPAGHAGRSELERDIAMRGLEVDAERNGAGEDPDALPAPVVSEITRRLAEIYATTAALPRDASLLQSMTEGALSLDILGWRCVYTLDLDAGRVIVVHATPLNRAA
jgi:hypothetical protein